MQHILTGQAEEGMVLAREVKTPEDRVLCGAGTELTLSLIERLKQMEISHITVEGHPVEIEGEKTIQEELLEIEERFSRVTETPPLMYLKNKIMERAVASRNE